jgi:tetraprenyl-beta-curcumene synthase
VAADGVREAVAVARALAIYRGAVLPRVRSGLERWEGAAAAIPDPALRGHALGALREKGLNVEATAVFATLAPRRQRPVAVAAMTALQVAVDYLDTLGEQAAPDPLGNGLALHGALVDALSPGAPVEDWYRLNPQRRDGGYLASLVSACRRAAASLPAAEAVLPAARAAARRCGEGQSHTHAAELGAASGGATSPLEAWAPELEAPPGYSWWELAAGASSSVAVHALIAAAADPRTAVAEAEAVDAAYFPPIGALTVLLDDLVDREEDLAAGAHNYTAYYQDDEEAGRRLALLAARARTATESLRDRYRHRAILAGVAGFYLAAPGARSDHAEPAAEALLDALGPSVRLIATFMRRGQPGAEEAQWPGGTGK